MAQACRLKSGLLRTFSKRTLITTVHEATREVLCVVEDVHIPIRLSQPQAVAEFMRCCFTNNRHQRVDCSLDLGDPISIPGSLYF